MSTAIAKNFQVGSDSTATNNFTIRQPATPDGTVRIANGNSGTTTDLVTVTSAGNVGVGTSSPAYKLDVSGTARISNGGDTYVGFGANKDNYWTTGTTSGKQVWRNSAGTEFMQLDSSGNLGIGTSSPESRLAVKGTSASSDLFSISDIAVPTSGAEYGVAMIKSASTDYLLNLTSYGATGKGFRVYHTGGVASDYGLLVTSGGGDRLIVDGSGNLLVGTTTVAQTLSTNNVLTLKSSGTAAIWGVGPTSSFGTFYVTNSGVGVSLAQGATSWGTVSDERQKDIIEPITDAANKMLSLRAVIGKYKTDTDGKRRSFLIAQDVQAVLPEAVDVGEDEAQTLSVRYTDTIPLLVAAIQELKAELDSVKTELALLKGTA